MNLVRSMKNLLHTKKIERVVDAFTEEYAKGHNPRVSYYVNNFKGNKQRLQQELMAIKIAYLIAHPHLDIKGDEESLQNLLIAYKTTANSKTRGAKNE